MTNPQNQPTTDRIGTTHSGHQLVTRDPYDCPTCGRRILARSPHQPAGSCAACTHQEPE